MGTERVFLKSISDELKTADGSILKYRCDIEHMYYWGEKDRTAYKYDLWQYLKEYLKPSDDPTKDMETEQSSTDNNE